VIVGAGGSGSSPGGSGTPGASGRVTVTWGGDGSCVADEEAAPGNQCTPEYYCSGTDLYHRNAQCTESLVQACVWGCAGGACLTPPPPQGNITATPTIVLSGNTSVISWSAENVASCTVTENNPSITDAWSGPAGAETSSGITEQTTYTLQCAGDDGSTFTDSAKVNIIPMWEEL
jgi:hypothetical protein